MKFRINKYIYIILLLTNLILISSSLPQKYEHKRRELKKSYLALSCKIDTFYFVLQYYIDDLPYIQWFIDQIPVKKDKYIKQINNSQYEIADPEKYCLGGFKAQLARFSRNNILGICKENNYYPAIYDKEGYIDVEEIYNNYKRIISFGLDSKLLIKTFLPYLNKKGIDVKYYHFNNPTPIMVAEQFADDINKGRIILCNGTVYKKNWRIFEFKLIGSDKKYFWKEATHCYAIIGYDFDKKRYLIADNYGSNNNPYQPEYRYMSFDEVFHDITKINKEKLDYSYSLGKNKI